MDLIKAFTNEQLKAEMPVVRIGDTIRVHNKIVEGTRERIQLFEGTVIAKHGGGISGQGHVLLEQITAFTASARNSAKRRAVGHFARNGNNSIG